MRDGGKTAPPEPVKLMGWSSPDFRKVLNSRAAPSDAPPAPASAGAGGLTLYDRSAITKWAFSLAHSKAASWVMICFWLSPVLARSSVLKPSRVATAA